MYLQKKISIVVPFFNEEHSIDTFHLAMMNLRGMLLDYKLEIICIDDGSSDATLTKLINLSRLDKTYQIIEFTRNFGKEPALTAGIIAATGDAVIPFDADLQDPPGLIPQMVAEWENGAEVVLAKRVNRSLDSFSKRTSASVFYKVHNLLSSLKIPENVGDFRLLSRAVVDALKQLPERQRFMKGLFAWVGFKAVTIEYHRQARKDGETKFSAWKLWNFALEGITSFSLIPLKIWTYIGGFGALFAFLYASFIILRTAIYGIDIPGYASLLVVILFFGSIQLISLGVLGEYIGRIYFETKNRPLYLIRKIHTIEGE
jgi:glycosyltransferase involved in cell wall biosynthesis